MRSKREPAYSIAFNGLESTATTTAEKNDWSRRGEMQADCLSGLFIRSVSQSAGLTQADLTNIAATARAVGDDTLSGKANIDGNHGLAADRQYWYSSAWRRRRSRPATRSWPRPTPYAEPYSGARATTSAVAIAATPSPRPVKPMPSVVVADRLTAAPSAADRTPSASVRRALRRGLLPMSCTETLPIS